LEGSSSNKRYQNNLVNTAGADLDSRAVSGRFYWRVMPNTYATAELRNIDNDYINAKTNNNADNRALVGVTWDVTQITSGSLKFGHGPYMIADGLIFALADNGLLVTMEATHESCRPLAQFQVFENGHDAWGPMAMVSGRLDLARVCAAPLDEARAELLAVRGIGPWTAELVLLYAVGAMDAFPTGDVGLMEAHKRLGGCGIRMDSKAFTAHAERWRPYRGVATHLLWAWLHIDRARDAAPGTA
jgi:hypothetical protein